VTERFYLRDFICSLEERCWRNLKDTDKMAKPRKNDSYRYTLYFEPQTDGSFAVVFPVFPEIVTFGGTLDEARATARDALRCHLEGLRKDGAAIPVETPPAGQQIREEVVLAL
jgi:predicted RNase H-like HicB family nuclease